MECEASVDEATADDTLENELPETEQYIPRFDEYATGILRRSDLLEKTRDPKAIHCANISDKYLKAIDVESPEDFCNLRDISAAENRLTLNEFKRFKYVETLVLSCNHIESLHIAADSFLHLKTLDLSFNRLNDNALIELSKLPSLQVLNLMGNEISRILCETVFRNETMDTDADAEDEINAAPMFPMLAVLNLSKNKILGDCETWWTLSQLKCLRILNVSYNRIEACNAEIDAEILIRNCYAASQFFNKLEELDLSFNRIDDRALVKKFFSKCRKLKKVALTKNPLTAAEADIKNLSIALEFQGVSLITISDARSKPPSPKSRSSRPSSGTFYKGTSLKTIADVKIEKTSKLTEKSLLEQLTKASNETALQSSKIVTASLVKPTPTEKDAWNFAGVEIKSAQDIEKKTFLTGIDLIERIPLKKDIAKQQQNPQADLLKKLLEADKQAHIPLPGSLLQSYRALRRVVDAPPELINILPATRPRENSIKKKKKPSKKKSDMECLNELMIMLDEKLEIIDTNLTHVMGNEKLQSKIPHSSHLLNEAQEEYQKLQVMLLKAAERNSKLVHS